MKRKSLSILDAVRDPNLFGRWFRGTSWSAWFALLAMLFGLRMTEEQRETCRKHTGRKTIPDSGFSEAWLCCGRRAGKSLISALVAVYLAVFRDYTSYLGPGEFATIMVIAADRRQARVVLRFIKGFLFGVALLAKLIVRETRESIELSNRVIIEVHTASFRTVRGYTIAAVICDEIAFWPNEDSAAPDKEILDALRPATATIPGARLICISSPYSKRGELWRAFQLYYGKEGASVLFWKADSRSMNPSLDELIVAEAYERDPAAASADYGAEFRSDLESLFAVEAVQACVASGRREIPRTPGVRYFAFVDPSGGSSDSMTLAIAHRDKSGKAVLDCVRERRPPFSPDDVVKEFAMTLYSYAIGKVVGDAYGGEWPRERFRKQNIEYELSDKSRSDLYLELLPIINARRVEILDEQRLVSQLTGLERRTSRSGKDTVDHRPGGHDDVANAAAGALVAASATGGVFTGFLAVGGKGGVQIVRGNDNSDLPPGVEVERIWWRK
jgi:Terminase large subunit, T4likevirus-type, N-terminal